MVQTHRFDTLIPARREVLDLPLSDEEPIRATRNTYTSKLTESLFDMHYALEMGLVLRGKMRRWSGEESKIKRTSDVWFCGMWEPHGFELVQQPWNVQPLPTEADSVPSHRSLCRPVSVGPSLRGSNGWKPWWKRLSKAAGGGSYRLF